MPNNMKEVIFEVIVFGGFNIVISWFLQILNEKKERGEELDEKAEELFSSAEEFKKLIMFPQAQDIIEKIRDGKNKELFSRLEEENPTADVAATPN